MKNWPLLLFILILIVGCGKETIVTTETIEEPPEPEVTRYWLSIKVTYSVDNEYYPLIACGVRVFNNGELEWYGQTGPYGWHASFEENRYTFLSGDFLSLEFYDMQTKVILKTLNISPSSNPAFFVDDVDLRFTNEISSDGRGHVNFDGYPLSH